MLVILLGTSVDAPLCSCPDRQADTCTADPDNETRVLLTSQQTVTHISLLPRQNCMKVTWSQGDIGARRKFVVSVTLRSP